MPVAPALDLRFPEDETAVAHIPHNIDAEQALLGAILFDNSAYERLSDQLTARHFYEPFHARLFAAMETHIRKGQLAEPIVLAEQFKRDPSFEELGGLRYLADLVDRAPPAANAPDFARLVYELSLRRELIRIGGDISVGANQSDPERSARDQIESAEQQLYALAETGAPTSGLMTFDVALRGAVEMAAEAFGRDGGLSGVSTGLIDLDQRLGGLHGSDLIILAARPSMGKAQPLDANVLRADGTWTTMGALAVGDALASNDGAPSIVTGIYPQGERELYRVTLSDGRSTECCAEHLWQVSFRQWSGPRVLSAREIAQLIEKPRYKRRIWIDPVSGDFGETAALPIDPWVLGALLGDGDICGGTPRFSTADKNTLSVMATRLGDHFAITAAGGYDYRIVTADGKTRAGLQGTLPNALVGNLKDLGLHGRRSSDKFIPPIYLQASRGVRVDLLRGLLDTDGWVETFGAVRFCSVSRALADGVVELVRSLGGQAGIGERSPRFTHNGEKRHGQLAYVVNISNLSADELFTVPGKVARLRVPKRTRRLNIVSIEPTRRSIAQCIRVSHPSSLYVTDDYILTHNTALATNIAFNVAKSYAWEPQPDGTKKTVNGGVVAFFSLEMSAEQLAMRLLADVSGVSSDRLRKGEIDASEFGRVRDAAMDIQSAPLFIDATGGISISKLTARARRLKRQAGLDLIVVDYLQLVTAGEGSRVDNRVQEVSMITQGLKALAKELSVPIIALAQLSRQVEQREDKRPQLSDLRESGSIEQDADVVMFIYREAYYKSRAEPREGSPEHLAWQEDMDRIHNLAEVIIGKQRHGPIGTVKLHFNADLTKFSNLAREGRFEPH